MSVKSKTVHVVELNANAQNLSAALNNLKKDFKGMTIPPELEKVFTKLENSIGSVLRKTEGGIISREAFIESEKEISKIKTAFESLYGVMNSFKDLSDKKLFAMLPGDTKQKIDEINKAYSAYEQSLKNVLKAEHDVVVAQQKKSEAIAKAEAAERSRSAYQGVLTKAEKEVKKYQDVTDALKEQAEAAKELESAERKLEKAQRTGKSEKSIASTQAEVDIAKERKTKADTVVGEIDPKRLNAQQAAIKKVTTAEENYAAAKKDAQAASRAKTQAEALEANALAQLGLARDAAAKESEKEASALNRVKQALAAVNPAYADLKLEGETTEEQLNNLRNVIANLSENELVKLKNSLNNASGGYDKLQDENEELKKSLEKVKEETKATDSALSQREALENKIKSFLGLSGAAQVLRHSLRDAMQTITELDSTMTEMAVVTDLTVGDYWDQLPEYSQRASELGVSINSAYKAATLYYQQGLKTNEVNEISTQTLKMAKIAGMDAAQATNKMTAALRGFNMELNEASAQKVADVYSELAAITAADTKEIANAMTKTASIAASAGMEFETTAAFLAQIVETTRESAETAGTAMKTVIARFQELKKSPDEIGEIDGEIVDANAIETALRSVGVSLRDANGQFRDLDDVFLELSSKWNGLDKNTQRYIATIAAGSRQQSRFIAMMSDYARTSELVSAANNSAGASQKQFEKTMDSLEAKVEKLKNAWHEFTMGIMNSDFVKAGVDILTKFLEIINKSTNAFDGLFGSITKIASILTIFKVGQKIFEKLKAPIWQFFDEIIQKAGITGEKTGDAFQQGMENSKKKTQEEKPKTTQEKEKEERQKEKKERNKQKEQTKKDQKNEKRLGLAKAAATNTQGKTIGGEAKKTVAEIKNLTQKAISQTAQGVDEMTSAITDEINRKKISSALEGADAARQLVKGNVREEKVLETNIALKETELQNINQRRLERQQNVEQVYGNIKQKVGEKVAPMVAPIKERVDDAKAAKSLKEEITYGQGQLTFAKANGNEQDIAKAQAFLDQKTQELSVVQGRQQERKQATVQGAKNTAEKVGGFLMGDNLEDAKNANQKAKESKENAIKLSQELPGQKAAIEKTQAKMDNLQNKKGGIASLKKQKAELEAIAKSEKASAKEREKAKNQLMRLDKNLIKQEKEYAKSEKELATQQQNYAKTEQSLAKESEAYLANQEAMWESIGSGVSEAGAKITGVGVAVSTLGGIFQSIGLTEVGEAFSSVGQIITVFGGALTALGPAISMVGKVGTSVAAKLTAAGWSTQAAWWWIALIAAAVMLLIVGIIALFAAIKNNSPEAKLKKAEAAAEAAGEAADQAAEAYQNLADSLDGLKDKYKSLETLVKGTEEWNEAVNDVTNSVMDLIEKYPELAGFVENEGGVLKLDVESDEVKQVLNDYEKRAVIAKGSELGAKIKVSEAKNNLALSELSDKSKIGLEKANMEGAKTAIGSIAGGAIAGAVDGAAASLISGPMALALAPLTAALGAIAGASKGVVAGAIAAPAVREKVLEDSQKDTDALATAMAKGDVMKNEESIFKYLTEELGYSAREAKTMADRLAENADELKDYGEQLVANNAAMDAYYQAMSMQAQSLIDLGKYSQKQVEQMTAVVDGDIMEDYVDSFSKEYEDMGSAELNDAKEEYAKSLYGDSAKVDGNKITYTDAEGKEQTREFEDDKEWIAAMAAADATEKAAKSMEEVPGMLLNSAAILNSRDEGAGQAFIKAMSSDKGEKLTKGELDNLVKNVNTDDLESAWENLTDEQKEIYEGDFLKYVEQFNEAIEGSKEAFEKAEKSAEKLGITLNDKLSAAAAQGWTDKLNILAAGGTDVSGLNAALDSVLAGMTAEQAESFMAQLNNTDFSSIDSWDNFANVVKELNLPVTNFEEFVNIAKETSNAIKKIDFNTLNDQLESTYALINKINSNTSRSFSEEDYNAIVAENGDLADSFRKVGDKFVYIGGNISDLTDALYENTEATSKAANQQLDFLIKAGEIAAKEQNIAGDASSMDRDQLISYLTSMQSQLNASGLDASLFGISGLTSNTDFTQISDTDTLREMASAMQTAGANVDYNKNQYSKNLEDANITSYIYQNTAQQNAQFAAMGGDQASAHAEALITQAAMSGGVSDKLLAEYRDTIDKANAEGATTDDKARAAELGEIIAERTSEVLEENESRSSFEGLVDRVTDAIYNARQQEIDKLSEVNESINNAQSAMVNKIQEQINNSRQQRENEKAEKNISDLRSKQAYLMSDTSGASSLAALEVNASIEEAEQEYQDSLVDQALQKLSDSNEEAAQQRERQIRLMEMQLEADSKSGEIANQAAEIAKTSVEDIQKGMAPLETAMGKLLWESEGEGLGGLAKEAWVSQLNQTAAVAEKYLTLEQKKQESEGITASPGENDNIINVKEQMEEVQPASEEILNFWQLLQKFFTQDIPNWWNTFVAPMFTGDFWATQWENIVAWWNQTVAPIFTGEFWSQKFFEAGVAFGEFIKYLAAKIEEIGNNLRTFVQNVKNKFIQIGIDIAAWWDENIAPIFTKEYWLEKWQNIVDGAKNAWEAFSSFFTETIPAWWNENIAPIFTKEYWAEKWDSFVQGLVSVWDKVTTFFNEKIKPIFTKEYWQNLVAKIGEGIKTGFEAAINAVIKGLNNALKGLADIYNNSIGSFIAGVASVFGGKDVGKITYTEIQPVKFKEGGLADFTGPAWLDGTKSKPEIVLNQRDSANFMELRDILAEVLNGKDSLKNKEDSKNGSGDNYFDIDVNVEKIDSDYDVEQIANKIRRMIYDDASYRNVNAVKLIR